MLAVQLIGQLIGQLIVSFHALMHACTAITGGIGLRCSLQLAVHAAAGQTVGSWGCNHSYAALKRERRLPPTMLGCLSVFLPVAESLCH